MRSMTSRLLPAASVVVMAMVAMVGCTSPQKGTDAPAAGGGDGGVPWSDYAGDLRGRIDGLAASKDCSGLQQQFDNADANNAATMTRTGHNNATLMGYIDDKMRAAGCY